MSRSAPSIVDLLRERVQQAPQREAVVFQTAGGEKQRLTYAELVVAMDRRRVLLSALSEKCRVGLVAPHGPAFLVDALAILAAGHCLVPINGTLPACEKSILEHRAGIHALLENDHLRLLTGQPIDGRNDADYRAIEPAYLRFTSGSTGQRKGVLLGHRTILERSAAANARLQIAPADRVLCLLPMVDHFVVSILLYLRYGATILLTARDEDAPKLAESEKATVLYGSPQQFTSFASPLPELRLAVSTTQGLSDSIAWNFLKNTGQPLVQALGIIEAGLLSLNDRRAKTHPLLAGEPMPAYQISIVGPLGNSGEIHVAGPGLLDAYVDPWRFRSDLLVAGAFPTGDHGWIDETGCLHLAGRANNRLNIDGTIYFSEELEARLNQHADLLESLVAWENERLVVRIVLRKTAAQSVALSAWIKGNLPSSRLTADVQFVDHLPRTATGKLARHPAEEPTSSAPTGA